MSAFSCPALYCVGNAMVDVFAEVPPDFRERFGLSNPVQHIAPEKAAAILAALTLGDAGEACRPENVPSVTIVSGGAQEPQARHRACYGDTITTACRQKNVSPITIASGGAQKPQARHRACYGDASTTACCPENVPSVTIVAGGAQEPQARHRACYGDASNTACRPENIPAVTIVAGGAQEPQARHRACYGDASTTACRQKKVPAVTIVAGGGAANTAKIAARLGVHTVFAGAVGEDSFAGLFAEEQEQAGVSLRLARKKTPTGVFISLGNCIAASPSAALELDAGDIDEAMFDGCDGSPRILFTEGFLLDREELVRRILELVKKYCLTLAIDLGTAEIAEGQARLIQQKHSFFWESAELILKNPDIPMILFFNETEAEAFTKTLNSTWQDLFTAASRNNELTIAVKLAERGAAVFSGGALYRVRTRPIEAVESTGAGDAFAAGFLAARIRGENSEQCGRAGNAAAALVLCAPGTAMYRE